MQKRQSKNLWKIISEYKKDNRRMLKIACPACGLEYEIRKTKYRDQRACRRCRFVVQNRKSLGSHRGIGDLTRTFYNYFKNTAKRRNVKFSVSIEYLWELAVKQDMKCALSGMEIVFPTVASIDGAPIMDETTLRHMRIGSGHIQAASLDRIDSSKSYEEGNVQWTNKYVNIMKNGFSQDEFIFYCHKVALLHDNPELSELKGNKK